MRYIACHWHTAPFDPHPPCLQVVKILLSHGGLVDGHASSKCTPLLRAAFAGSLESCRILLDAGASVDARDMSFGDGRTPLLKAAGQGHEAVAALLIERGADISARDAARLGAFDLAQGHPGVLAILGADQVNLKCPEPFSSVERAVEGVAALQVSSEAGTVPRLSDAAPPPPQSEIPSQCPAPKFGMTCPGCSLPVLVVHRAACCRRLLCGDCKRMGCSSCCA